jgi:hypothetical protein
MKPLFALCLYLQKNIEIWCLTLLLKTGNIVHVAIQTSCGIIADLFSLAMEPYLFNLAAEPWLLGFCSDLWSYKKNKNTKATLPLLLCYTSVTTIQ